MPLNMSTSSFDKGTKFRLEYLNKPEHIGHFNETQLDLLISFTGQFEQKGFLSEKQLKVIDSLWEQAN